MSDQFNQKSLKQKITTSLMSGIQFSALLLLIGNGGNIPWLPPILVFSLIGLTLLSCLIFPLIWQNLQNKQQIDSVKIYGILYSVIRLCIAISIACFGWKKIFGLQFIVPEEIAMQPMNKQNGEWLTWYYFGFSQTFGILIALIQIIGSTLILFRRTLLFGAVVLFAFMLNLTLINIFYDMNLGALLQSVITTSGIGYLLLLNYSEIKAFFFKTKSELPTVSISKRSVKNKLRILVILISLAFTIYLKVLTRT